VGVKARIAADLTVRSSQASVAGAVLFERPHHGPEGIRTAELDAKAASPSTPTAEHRDSKVPSITVTVFKPEKITFDGRDTEAGMQQRLLLSVPISPSISAYKSNHVKTAMDRMIVAVESRAQHPKPGPFMARDTDRTVGTKKTLSGPRDNFTVSKITRHLPKTCASGSKTC